MLKLLIALLILAMLLTWSLRFELVHVTTEHGQYHEELMGGQVMKTVLETWGLEWK